MKGPWPITRDQTVMLELFRSLIGVSPLTRESARLPTCPPVPCKQRGACLT